MRILVFACVYGRPRITEIFSMGIERLKNAGHDVVPFTVCSADEDYDVCMSLSLNPVKAPNSPLGRKHNIGLEHAFSKRFSHVLLMGSDNLISAEGLQMLIDANKNHVGFRKMIAVDTATRKTLIHEYEPKTRMIGAGRLVSREALELTSRRTLFYPRNEGTRSATYSETGQVFPVETAKHLERRHKGRTKGLFTGAWDESLEKSLDNSLDTNLSLCGFPPYTLEPEKIHIIDIKSHENIHQFGAMKVQEGKILPFTGDYGWFLSDAEKKAIEALKTVK